VAAYHRRGRVPCGQRSLGQIAALACGHLPAPAGVGCVIMCVMRVGACLASRNRDRAPCRMLCLAGVASAIGLLASAASAAEIKIMDQKGLYHKGIYVEMKAGPLPNHEPRRGQMVHVISTRGLSWAGNQKWWVETGYQYVPPGYQGACQCWKIFYATNALLSNGQCSKLDANRSYYAALGPANPGEWHTFESIKGPNGNDWTWGVKVDGTVFTWIALPDSRGTDWAAVAQMEVYDVKEAVRGEYREMRFYHSPGGTNWSPLTWPFKVECLGNLGSWSRRPGYRDRNVGPRYQIHDGPIDPATCPR
jgi:hypothetical protein